MELNALVVFTLRNETPVPIKRQSGWRAEPSGHVLEEEHICDLIKRQINLNAKYCSLKILFPIILLKKALFSYLEVRLITVAERL